MLTISTIPEALAELGKQTARAWTASELFDVATVHGISLHAAPPITAETTIQEFVIGEGMRVRHPMGPGSAALAVLFPWQVGQLWISGETNTQHPSDHDSREGTYHWFTEPVRVTREQVRIKAETLQKILTIWRDAQTGGTRRVVMPGWIAPAAIQQDISEMSEPIPAVRPWTVKAPMREQAYNRPLYRLLFKASQDGAQRPTARDVLAAWMAPNTPPEVSNVTVNGLEYETRNGDKKAADREAIGKAIGRMTNE